MPNQARGPRLHLWPTGLRSRHSALPSCALYLVGPASIGFRFVMRGSKDDQDRQILSDVMKAVLDFSRDKDRGAGFDGVACAVDENLTAARDDVVNLVLDVRRLAI